MHHQTDILSPYASQISVVCRRHRVLRLELFGSAAGDRFDQATSDLDFFVDFDDRDPVGAFSRYMGLKFDLEDLLGRPVDLVERCAVRNPLFLQVADRQKQLIYAA